MYSLRADGGQMAHEQREAMGSTATTKTTREEPGPEHRWAVVVVAVIGVGLVVAPFAFGMFSKAPKGAVMIDGFAPYMTTARLDGYQRELSEINAGVRQTDTSVAAYLNAAGADPRGFDAAHPGFASFDAQWPAIDSKMTGLMDQVQGNLGNYQAVAALPSFKLFPWFFVIPGVLIAGVAVVSLLRPARWRRGRWVLVVLGVGLVAAPAVFQMFQRAPDGGRMMTAFENIETTQNVEQIQGFFGSMAVGQGAIRLDIVPALEQTGLTHARDRAAFSGPGHARCGLGAHPQRHDPDDRGDERQRDQLPGRGQPAPVPALPVVLRDPGRPGRRARGGRRHPARPSPAGPRPPRSDDSIELEPQPSSSRPRHSR